MSLSLLVMNPSKAGTVYYRTNVIVFNCAKRKESIMAVSYKKLWHLLIDRGINKQDLRHMAGISTASIAKLGKGENMTTDVLVKICRALNCDIGDIMEVLPENEETKGQENG